MVPTLLPGANRDHLLKTLREIHDAAYNLRGRGAAMTECIEWATDAVEHLGNQITAADLSRLVLTPAMNGCCRRSAT